MCLNSKKAEKTTQTVLFSLSWRFWLNVKQSPRSGPRRRNRRGLPGLRGKRKLLPQELGCTPLLYSGPVHGHGKFSNMNWAPAVCKKAVGTRGGDVGTEGFKGAVMAWSWRSAQEPTGPG